MNADTFTLTTKKKNNFFQMENEFVDKGYMAMLTGSALMVYIALSRHSNYTTAVAFPSISKMASEAGLDRKSVIRGVQELENLGFIIKIKNGGDGRGSNHYEVQELSSVKVVSKNKKSVKPPVAKEKTAEVKAEIKANLSSTYNMYTSILKLYGKSDISIWPEETFIKKIEGNNVEVIEECYKHILHSTDIKQTTLRVYVLSPSEMIKQLYPIIKPQMNQKKIDGILLRAKEQNLNTVEIALETGVVTQEDYAYYLECKAEITKSGLPTKSGIEWQPVYMKTRDSLKQLNAQLFNQVLNKLGVEFKDGKHKLI